MKEFLEDKFLSDIKEYDNPTNWLNKAYVSTAVSVKAIDTIIDKLEDLGKINIEGEAGTGWVIVSWEEIVIHIFSEEMRKYYRLDELWENTERQ